MLYSVYDLITKLKWTTVITSLDIKKLISLLCALLQLSGLLTTEVVMFCRFYEGV